MQVTSAEKQFYSQGLHVGEITVPVPGANEQDLVVGVSLSVFPREQLVSSGNCNLQFSVYKAGPNFMQKASFEFVPVFLRKQKFRSSQSGVSVGLRLEFLQAYYVELELMQDNNMN